MTLAKIGQDQAQQKIGRHLAPDDRHPVSQVFETLEASIRNGSLAAIVQFLPVGDKFSLLTAIELQQEEGLSTSLRAIMPYVKQDENVEHVTTRTLSDSQAELHCIRNKTSSQEDREIYGDDLGLYIGTSPQTGWFAVGGVKTEELLAQELKSRQQAVGIPFDETNEAVLLEARWSFRPWIELAVRNQSEDEMLSILQQAFPSGDGDEVLIRLSQANQGLHADLRGESGYHRMLGIVCGEILKRGETE